ncbi:MAG: hypothetical protein KBS93_10855 [Flavobacteriaceae bacterium]|nr:hypothetical protein [Candidatus Onthonaster equi]
MNHPKYENNTDVSLGSLFSLAQNLFKSFIQNIICIIKFLLANIKSVLGIIVIGLAIGYFLDYNQGKTYRNEIIVAPKFNSVDYLYNAVNNYESDLSNLDAKYAKHVKKVEINAIEDIYGFVAQTDQTLQVFKILAENGDIKKLLTDENTARNYRYHKLVIYTDTPTNQSIVNTYLKHLNSNNYFVEKQKVSVKNAKLKIEDVKISINQINLLLDKAGEVEQQVSNNFNINTASESNDIINTKSKLISDLNWLETDLIEQSKVIFDVSMNLNIKQDKFFLFRSIFYVPAFLLSLFLLSRLCFLIYRKYAV